MKIGTNTHVLRHVLPLGMQGMDVSLGTDIQSIREIDDSGYKVLAEIDNMMTNMTGSSILKSTGHTSLVKPVNLSVRFILGDGEPHSEDFSDSESEGTLDSDDDWESCVSSVEEDECFYDADSLDDSQDASYSSFPTRSLSSVSETNLSMGWKWAVRATFKI